ncbi:MAG: hypothetical protein NTZ92_01375 [Candidatus Omnitrophica bacterium]|nr:hypothetical protein [Candidatus Omnitrophota bacterium]
MMKKLLLVIGYWLLVIAAAGCATVTEGAKCVAGVSTKALEDGRKTAIKKTFNFDYITCDTKVREVLKSTGAYIYADKKAQKLIAIYMSEFETTPVGIFFTEVDPLNTQVELSSPSTEAKEIESKKIFNFLEGKTDNKEDEKGQGDDKGLFGGE